MPPEPITLHTHETLALVSPSKRRWLSHPHPSGNRVFVGYTMGSKPDPIATNPTNGVASGSGSDAASSSTSIVDTPPTTPSISSIRRRKMGRGAFDYSSLLVDDKQRYISLKPKTSTIIQRCIPASGSSSSSSSPPAGAKPTAAAIRKKQQAAASAAAAMNRWSRATDLGNSRSNVPSPREVERAKVKEQERIKARVEAAALKKVKKAAAPTTRRRGSNGKTTRVQSPQDKDKEQAELGGSLTTGNSAAPATAVTDQPNSNSTSINHLNAPPFPPRVGLKRTRSTGGGINAISTALANSLGAGGAPAVSSPLKAVTGPNTPEDDQEGQQQRKRSRLSDPTDETSASASAAAQDPGSGPMKRKASSHSPPSRTADPLPSTTAPNTIPTATLPLPLKRDSIEMRRAASTSNLDSAASRPSRRSSFGVEARERSKREVILPGRLRDYDVRSSSVLLD